MPAYIFLRLPMWTRNLIGFYFSFKSEKPVNGNLNFSFDISQGTQRISYDKQPLKAIYSNNNSRKYEHFKISFFHHDFNKEHTISLKMV